MWTTCERKMSKLSYSQSYPQFPQEVINNETREKTKKRSNITEKSVTILKQNWNKNKQNKTKKVEKCKNKSKPTESNNRAWNICEIISKYKYHKK